jgi:hypothetical protein
VAGGLAAGLAAAPGVRRALAGRLPWRWRGTGDPLAPFLEAPCHRPEPAPAPDAAAGRTEAMP